MSLNYKIKIIYDMEEHEYVVFVEGIDVEGFGQTEQEAIEDFELNLKRKLQ